MNDFIKMLRLTLSVLLYCSVWSKAAEPLAPVPPVIPPLVPSPLPLPFGRAPGLLPGYNNPYYNPNGAPLVPILTYSNENNGDGNYAFSFTTGDGKQAQETGFLKDAYIDNAGEPQGTLVVQGSYAYVAPDGTPIQVSYTADENGFRTSGVHIPSDGKAVIPPLSLPVPGSPVPGVPLPGLPLPGVPLPGVPLSGVPLPGVPVPGVPLGVAKDPNQIYNPLYNRVNYRNPYGTYNNQLRPYDPRYPYDPTKYNPYSPYNNGYGPFRNNWLNKTAKNLKEEIKKDSA